jgi:acetyl esterase/lipase
LRRRTFIASAALALAGCGGGAAPANTRTLQYGNDQRQAVDITVVELASPWIAFIHGGGWSGGSRDDAAMRAVTGRLQDRGYNTAAIGYRVLGQAAYAEQTSDIISALAMLERELRTDAGVLVAGGSAGGYHAMEGGALYLLAGSSRVRGLMSLAGPLDLDPACYPNPSAVEPLFEAFAGDSSQRFVRSPTLRVARGEYDSLAGRVRLFATAIDHDTVVPTFVASEFVEMARVRGIDATLHIEADALGHAAGAETISRAVLRAADNLFA